MHAIRHDAAALERAVRWVVLVVSTVLALTVVLLVVVTSPARADPGDGPDQTGPDQEQLVEQFKRAQVTGTPTGMTTNPQGQDVWVGVPGTHVANGTYGYPYPAAGDCNEATLGGGCVGDDRGFLQGQCTSWVAFRLASRNGFSFSNWYADRHWGNASEWGKVAKSIGQKPDKTPAIGSIGWYKRGHVSYVEDVYYGGTIVISEMNTDGHNGFHFTTVSPGMRGYPDKFIHLDDVVPVDTTPPTVPTDVRVVAHRGRTGITWRGSSDAFGVAGYRVMRNGVPLGSTQRTSYWDRTPPSGQSAVYSVVAYDATGHVSGPGNARVVPGSEAVDRAWLDTGAGPGLCGRTGSADKPRLGCRLLGANGWRSVISAKTQWGGPVSRAFVTGASGAVSYCRNLGLSQRTLACTALETGRRTWQADVTSGRTPHTEVADRAWVTTASGPAQCGRTGTPAKPRVTCSVLGAAGWQSSTAPGRTDWGTALSRAFVAGHDGTVSFCRTLGAPGHLRAACRTFHPETQMWSADDVATTSVAKLPANATWLGATAGPALCWSPAAGVRGGCQVLSGWGWQVAKLSKKADAGAPATRAFLVDRGGAVSWCRIGGHSRTVACAGLRPSGNGWETGRSTRVARALRYGSTENRAWVSTSAGPALCGRTGTVKQQRVGCQVLTGAGWRFTGSQRTPWGLPGYRAFVPSGAGVAYCRTVAVKRGTTASCISMSRLDWGVTKTARRAPMALADSF
ncbi:MAG: CHAP domain-containing protein [Nocardioides sp.]